MTPRALVATTRRQGRLPADEADGVRGGDAYQPAKQTTREVLNPPTLADRSATRVADRRSSPPSSSVTSRCIATRCWLLAAVVGHCRRVDRSGFTAILYAATPLSCPPPKRQHDPDNRFAGHVP
ncbi:hypothetical protein PMIN04_004159 [Paraphaeosphaeria minitans]